MIRRILVLGVVSLALGAAVRLMTAPAPAVAGSPRADGAPDETLSATARDGRSLLREVATVPTPRLRSLGLSPEGSTLAWVDDRGSVRRVDVATQRTLWRTEPMTGVNRVCATRDGHVVAASLMNPALPEVHILHPRWGEKHAASFSLSGAVWDMVVERDGGRVLVGTGDRAVHVLPVQAGTPGAQTRPAPSPARWTATGIPASLAVASPARSEVGPVVLLGLWQQAGVNARGLGGDSRWRADSAEPERDYDVRLSADGSTAVAVSARRGRGPGDLHLEVWDVATGKRLWSETLDADSGRAQVSRDGQYIALSYVLSGEGGGPSSGYRIALFDRQGQRQFADKGSAVFHPRLVSLSADGSRLVVHSGLDTIFVLDRNGRFLGRRRLTPPVDSGRPASIESVTPSDDGRYFAVRRSDDRVTLLKATF